MFNKRIEDNGGRLTDFEAGIKAGIKIACAVIFLSVISTWLFVVDPISLSFQR